MLSHYGSPSQAAPTLEYVDVGKRLFAHIINGMILLIVGWMIVVVFSDSGDIAAIGDA